MSVYWMAFILLDLTSVSHECISHKPKPTDTTVFFEGKSISDGEESIASSSVTRDGETERVSVSSDGDDHFEEFFGEKSHTSVSANGNSASVRQSVGS
uniref:Male reproductive-related protein n=1 Tax=Macrobrachium rosenbergii TaxID=79674 RepID=B8LG44_MACRS|nr:male reproductive-related protein [Macrobrachium rosenbergii]